MIHYFYRTGTKFLFSILIYVQPIPLPFPDRIPRIFTSRIYIYNISRCQEWISNYLGISIQKGVRNWKLEKQGLGCAIYIKEYTIMLYLANQIHGLITNHFD